MQKLWKDNNLLRERKVSIYSCFRVFNPETNETLKALDSYGFNGEYEWLDDGEYNDLKKKFEDILFSKNDDDNYIGLSNYLMSHYFLFSNRKKAVSILKELDFSFSEIKKLYIEYWLGPKEPLIG